MGSKHASRWLTESNHGRLVGRAILAQLSLPMLLTILAPECDICPTAVPGVLVTSTRLSLAHAWHWGCRTRVCAWAHMLSKLRTVALQTPLFHRPSPTPGGTEQEKCRSGLGRPHTQAGEGSCSPAAQGSAVAEPSSQEALPPTYQHPRRRADDASPLPSLPGSLPSPQAQPVLTFKAKCVSTILNKIPSCGLLSAGYIDHSN